MSTWVQLCKISGDRVNTPESGFTFSTTVLLGAGKSGTFFFFCESYRQVIFLLFFFFLKGNVIKIKSFSSPHLASETCSSFIFLNKNQDQIKQLFCFFFFKHLNLTFSKLITQKAVLDMPKLRSQ